MVDIIMRYLDKTYRMSIDDYYDRSVTVIDPFSRNGVSTTYFNSLILDVSNIFDLDMEDARAVVNNWWTIKESNYEGHSN